MKFIDEYRDPVAAEHLIRRIRAMSSRPWVLMEVCGGQTHSLLKYGIDLELRGVVEIIHGPGCPVCVTDARTIDDAIALACRPDIVLASFGDMLRVPGSSESLANARTRGARILTVYSPLDAVDYARRNPDLQVVFFAVGFETTAPATALAVLQARRLGLRNFRLLVAHVRVQPAMEMLMQSPGNRVQAFLAAGHVCCVTGYESYEHFVSTYRIPVVVTGFEPIDLLQGILKCVQQLESGIAEVSNCYERSVCPPGNPEARVLIDTVYLAEDREWRGMGHIRQGGYRIRDEFREFDASGILQPFDNGQRNADATSELDSPASGRDCPGDSCRAGDVLAGRLKPGDCPQYGKTCTPDHPLGAPMVSDEGACAAWYRYRERTLIDGRTRS